MHLHSRHFRFNPSRWRVLIRWVQKSAPSFPRAFRRHSVCLFGTTRTNPRLPAAFMSSVLRRLVALTVLLVAPLFAQETTGGLQGTVKETSGAVLPLAHVRITGTSLIGSKQVTTDDSGYYRFANLPPGNYKITVTAKDFATAERGGLVIEVGHLPSIDFVLQVGTNETVV